jgi:hypothetical protein
MPVEFVLYSMNEKINGKKEMSRCGQLHLRHLNVLFAFQGLNTNWKVGLPGFPIILSQLCSLRQQIPV